MDNNIKVTTRKKNIKRTGKVKNYINKFTELSGVSIVTCTNRPNNMKNVFNNYERQDYNKKQLIIILNNNKMNFNEWREEAKKHKNVKVFKLDEDISLGQCLNFAVDNSDYEFIAKFDDDDYYGVKYLKNQMKAFENTNAGIVGKRTCFVYFEKTKTLAMRYPNKENCYVKYVLDSSMIIKRRIFNKIRFPNYTFKKVGADFHFQQLCYINGINIFATDRYDYVVHRHVNPENHTFKIEDEKILNRSIIVEEGIANYTKHISSESKKLNRNIKDIKIASILDEFSYECFKHECKFIPLGLNDWEQKLIEEKPDLLLVESAWQGYNNEWIYKIVELDKKNDNNLKKLVNWCKDNNIPTVFWCKEDPYDFNKFIEAAKLFDYVFTTDANCVPKYKKILSHNNIYVLPFAAQPKIHNPIINDGENLGKVAFAGGWYAQNHGKRTENMSIVLKPAFKYDLDIYDRFYHRKGKYFRFPHEFNPYIKKPLSYNQIIDVYKKYDIFLNVNSVEDSPTNFARRVFELLACGTPVISSYSLGIKKYFGGIVKLCKSLGDTEKYLKILLEGKQLRDKISLLGLRKVLEKHTYKHRLETILDNIRLKYREDSKLGVSIITCTKRPERLKDILKNYKQQSYFKKELIIIINNNSIDINKWKKKIEEYKNVRVYHVDEEATLGECLNFGVEKSNLEIISKFDDDDYYAPDYLTDIVNAFTYTTASIIGKFSIYAYFEDTRELVIRHPNRENIYTNYIASGTLTFKKEIFNNVKFRNTTGDEVIEFLNDCTSNDYKIYAIDRFNYIVSRRLNLQDHTWKITREEFLKKCKIIKETDDYIDHITI